MHSFGHEKRDYWYFWQCGWRWWSCVIINNSKAHQSAKCSVRKPYNDRKVLRLPLKMCFPLGDTEEFVLSSWALNGLCFWQHGRSVPVIARHQVSVTFLFSRSKLHCTWYALRTRHIKRRVIICCALKALRLHSIITGLIDFSIKKKLISASLVMRNLF